MSYHLRTLGVAVLLSGATYALFREQANRFARAIRARPKILWTAILLVAVVPMIWTTRNVVHYWVNVPRLDDWEMARLIVQQRAGELTWHDLFAQQQEARTILPKLIFLLSAATGKWDVRQQMAISLVAAALTAVGICFLLWKTRPRLLSFAVCLSIASLCIFSPAQLEVWLLASGFPSFLPALFIVAGLVAMRSRIPVPAQFATCAFAAIASSFTLPHGLLAWALTFPVLQRRWTKWLAAWIALAAGCAVIYFWGYAKPDYLPELAPRISASAYVEFFLIFLGGGFAYASTAAPALVAMCAGGVQIALLLGTMAYLAPRFRDEELRTEVMPWLALAAYAIASACLATIGRVGYGPTYALASRYVPFSTYLTIAAAVLVAIVFRQQPRRRLAWLAGTILCLGFATLYARAAATTIYFMRHDSARARLAHGALLFSRVFDTTAVLREIYPPDPALPGQLAAALDGSDLLRPRLIPPGTAIDELAGGDEQIHGCFEREFGGWSALLKNGRPADCVLLTYETPAHHAVAFAINDTLEPRYDIVKRFGTVGLLWSGWSATPRVEAIPAGARVSAWAINADQAQAYELQSR